MGTIQRISNHRKKLQGSASARYIKNTPDTAPITELWPPPKHLGVRGLEFYEHTGKILVRARVLTDLDRFSFIELAELYDLICLLRKHLREDGIIIPVCIDSHGRPASDGIVIDHKKHPAAVLLKDTVASFFKVSATFGLTPYDRKRIDLPTDENPHDEDRKFLGL